VQLVALVAAADHVCCRYRLAAFRPWLEADGHALALEALPPGPFARWRLFRRLRGASVILQRALLPGWQLWLLRRHARHLIFDFDDAVFLRDSYSRKGLHDARRRRRFAATVRACDAVIAGNAYLAGEAARFADRARVEVVPTCLDPARYAPKPAPGGGGTLVWVGSSSTLQGLEQIAPLLDEVGRRLPGVRLKVICDRFPRFAHLPVIACPWSEATEAAELAAADVGISRVPDDLWSRGKCGLKVLQYMAAGLPVVANPVGVQAEMVRHGVTGLLATTADEWVDAIRRLRADAELRRRMGAAGRQALVERYSLESGWRGWRRALAPLGLRATA
jgi:glycosyltransferase involved in cell wall biosynthesis